MYRNKSHIISQLQKDILSLQGIHKPRPGKEIDPGLGSINTAFPNHCFPFGAVHEFVSDALENTAAYSRFYFLPAGCIDA